MATLFSYRITHDTGAAPNPFWGVCTLVICKPAIRRTAEVGDWIVGTGSVGSPIGDCSHSVVHVMQVTRKMAMRDYAPFTRESLPEKIPAPSDDDPRRRAGDSIYDFSCDPPPVRDSVRDECSSQSMFPYLPSPILRTPPNVPYSMPAERNPCNTTGQMHRSADGPGRQGRQISTGP